MGAHYRPNRERMCAGLVAFGLSAILVVSSPGSSGADPTNGSGNPTPTSAGDAVSRLTQLSHQADVLNQQALTAQENLSHKQAAEREARKHLADNQAAVNFAQDRIAKYGPVVNEVANAMYQGARTDSMFAVLSADEPQQLLDQMSLLGYLGERTAHEVHALDQSLGSVRAAEQAAQRSADAADAAIAAANAAVADVRKKQTSLASAISQVTEAFGQLSAKDRQTYIGTVTAPGFDSEALLRSLPRNSRAGALAAALTRIGDPYVWGATGPNAFDCSGLVQWAYRQVGMNLPRTSEAQAEGGSPVDPDDMQPGDVVTFYSDASHVGIYVGNGQILHASTFGVPVQVMPLSRGGPIHNIRRY